MTVQKTDIEKALDELISYEEGVKFQNLAVILAKQKWPQFVAHEHKKDLGLDAYMSTALAPDGIGKGLACSLSANLKKIKDDAAAAKKNYNDIRVFVFATAQKVSNYTSKIWAEEIRKDFEYELIVIPRADIIASLSDPSNASLCSNHLGIPISIEPLLQEIADRARLAASEESNNWVQRLGLRPYIDLRAAKLDDRGGKTEEILYLEGIRASLLKARRVVLEAPAGRGKTTTLVLLAKPDRGTVGISLLIDLPSWMRAKKSILSYVAEKPAFLSQGIDAENLATLYQVEHLTFLLNGWNEISETYVDDANVALKELERDYPKAGICVATRTHYLSPPLPGAFRVELLPLSWAQRNEYLNRSLGTRANELGSKLDNDLVLDQLTRTPFILSEVVKIFESGRPIPPTRIGVLSEVIRLLEEQDDHRHYLRGASLKGHSEYYLAELALHMTERGTTTVLEIDARPIAHSVSKRLEDAGRIGTLPDPASVLNELCKHHILEKLNDQPDTFRFEHQQFQELYAALRLKQQLEDLVKSDSEDRDRAFARNYINHPKWGEPLRMLAEEIGMQSVSASRAQDGTDLVALGKHLVEVALSVDAIFAPELSRLCGKLVWEEVRTAVGGRLRSWYSTNEENNRQCALAGMIATGSGDFVDIILPLVTSDDSQVRLGAYRAGTEFHPTTLGPNWRGVVNSWSEKARTGFIWELALHGSNITSPEIIEHFALTDPSTKVRAEATQGLVWAGATHRFVRVLEALDDEAFEQAVQELDVRNIPPSARHRALTVWRQQLDKCADPTKRLQILLVAAELGEERIPEKLREQLAQLESRNLQNLRELVIRPSLRIIREADPEWASKWVADRILDGSLWYDHWIGLVTSLPESFKRELLETIGNEDLKEVGTRGIIPLLKATCDALLAESAWARLCEVQRSTLAAGDASSESERAIARQLESFIRDLPPNISVAGMSRLFAKRIAVEEITAVINVFSSLGNEAPDLRSELRGELRNSLRAYLKKGVRFVLSQDDFNGQMKAYLATALARVGEPEDITQLRRLTRADIERIKNGISARVRRKPGPMAWGAGNCWAHWHVRALSLLDPSVAEEALLELLCEPQWERYEIESASALVQSATIRHVSERFGHKRDYRDVWTARAGSQPTMFDEVRRQRYSQAITERISTLLSERTNNAQATRYDGRLQGLAQQLARLDGRGSSELVIKVMTLQEQGATWIGVEALEALLLSGASLPTEATLKILNPEIEHIRAQGVYEPNSAWSLVRCLCWLPFVDEPAIGIERIRQVISETHLWHSAFRDLFGALGSSRCSEALDLLTELAGADGSRMPEAFEEWVDAVATFGGRESTRILLSFIDPAAEGFDIPKDTARYGEGEVVVSRIVNLARIDPKVMQRIVQWCDANLPSARRQLLTKVIKGLGTVEAVLAGLNLIDDSSPLPYELRAALETIFLERRPSGKTGSSYTLEPRSSNEIRRSSSRWLPQTFAENNQPPHCWDKSKCGVWSTEDPAVNLAIRVLTPVSRGRRSTGPLDPQPLSVASTSSIYPRFEESGIAPSAE